jgi:GNAT superfamily N-acetyltransferase
MEEIRKARVADGAGIASLMTHLGYQTTADQMRRRLQRIAADKDYVSLVAAEEDIVLGFLGLAFGLYYEYDGTYARIVALSVAPPAQGRGLGTKLMAVAEEIAKSRGARSCIVNSGLQRASAHRFYESLGFSWQGKALYKPLPP